MSGPTTVTMNVVESTLLRNLSGKFLSGGRLTVSLVIRVKSPDNETTSLFTHGPFSYYIVIINSVTSEDSSRAFLCSGISGNWLWLVHMLSAMAACLSVEKKW